MATAVLLAMLAIVGGTVVAAPSTKPDAALSPLSPTLLEARFYAWGAVGMPAAVSPEEWAARDAYRRASVVQLMDGLSQATSEGQLYLLCILRKRDPVRYAQARSRLRLAAGLEVSTFEGNVLRRERAADILAQFERTGCAPLDWPLSPDVPRAAPAPHALPAPQTPQAPSSPASANDANDARTPGRTSRKDLAP